MAQEPFGNDDAPATKEGICGIIFYYNGWRRWQIH